MNAQQELIETIMQSEVTSHDEMCFNECNCRKILKDILEGKIKYKPDSLPFTVEAYRK